MGQKIKLDGVKGQIEAIRYWRGWRRLVIPVKLRTLSPSFKGGMITQSLAHMDLRKSDSHLFESSLEVYTEPQTISLILDVLRRVRSFDVWLQSSQMGADTKCTYSPPDAIKSIRFTARKLFIEIMRYFNSKHSRQFGTQHLPSHVRNE
uniref:Uncharacterized protein n=1 Tax=Timema tahoe TaxID=61484 RepID=A0A7R9IQR3_9NEOP|nr:unnamed protein product [Timema tahoe]